MSDADLQRLKQRRLSKFLKQPEDGISGAV